MLEFLVGMELPGNYLLLLCRRCWDTRLKTITILIIILETHRRNPAMGPWKVKCAERYRLVMLSGASVILMLTLLLEILQRHPTEKAYYIAKELLMTERTYKKDLEVIDLVNCIVAKTLFVVLLIIIYFVFLVVS
jgi:hypothetical protein